MQKEHTQPVKFYRKNQEYGYFSNFYSSPFEENGIKYPTSEHYFQSKKFEGHPYQLDVVKAPKPHDAFRMGQNRKIPIKENWNEIKEDVMYRCLTLKFTQHPDLKEKLLATGQRKIIEHTGNDSYWGDGLGKGKNRLGILLMQLRQEFKKAQKK